jgi:alkaline phosphatase D
MPVLTAPAANLDRRRLLQMAGHLATAALAAPVSSRVAHGQPRFASYPFALGVASGDPVVDGFVLWTRLAPDPLNGGGMPPEAVEMHWEVARDPRFLEIVRRGTALAAPEHGHAVHVDVQGLEPDRWYYYRFLAGGEASPVGRTRTFPAPGAPKERLRFAFASCQHYGQGFFTAYDAMMADELDLILHLGDYVYESDWGPKVRFHLPEPSDFEGYRDMHALYKSDPSLQAAHAWYPFLVTWDDHEATTTMPAASRRTATRPSRSCAGGRPPTRPITSTCPCGAAPGRSARTCGSTPAPASATSRPS